MSFRAETKVEMEAHFAIPLTSGLLSLRSRSERNGRALKKRNVSRPLFHFLKTLNMTNCVSSGTKYLNRREELTCSATAERNFY